MYKITTPTVTFTFPAGVDMTQAENVFVTFSDLKSSKIIEKTGESLTITSNAVEVLLTQEDTQRFPVGTVKVQINWTYLDEGITKRACTDVMAFIVRDNLHPEIISGSQGGE